MMTTTRNRRLVSRDYASAPSRLSSLGRPEAMGPGMLPSQRIAHELIAAERTLASIETHYLEARRRVAESARAAGGDGGRAPLALVESQRDDGRERVQRLRHQLYEERRREILLSSGPEAATAQRMPSDSANAGRRRTLLNRLLRRR